MEHRRHTTIREKEAVAIKAVAMFKDGYRMEAIAKKLEVSESSLSSWKTAYQSGRYNIPDELKDQKKITNYPTTETTDIPNLTISDLKSFRTKLSSIINHAGEMIVHIDKIIKPQSETGT